MGGAACRKARSHRVDFNPSLQVFKTDMAHMAPVAMSDGASVRELDELADHAAGTRNDDSAALAAVVPSSLRRAISWTTACVYVGSVRLFNFSSRLDRAPTKPMRSNAIANSTSLDAARQP